MATLTSKKNTKTWKTGTGAILLAVGTGFMAANPVAPSPEIGQWCMFMGTMLSGIGTALMGYGIASRISAESDKPKTMVVKASEMREAIKPKPLERNSG